jgi:hypothetical protein
MPSSPDTFYAECVIATAEDAPVARIELVEFLKTLNPRLADTPEMILKDGLSPSGESPATRFLCTRHVHQGELDAFDALQTARAASGKLPIAIEYYVSQEPLVPVGGGLRAALNSHESKVLTRLGLRRIM